LQNPPNQSGPLSNMLEPVLPELENSDENNPNHLPLNSRGIASTSCYSASCYNWLRMMKANVEPSYIDFFRRWTAKVPRWNPGNNPKNRVIEVNTGTVNAMDEIINSYKVNGRSLLFRATRSESEFLNSKANSGVVVINAPVPGRQHMFNVYKENGIWRTSDVGGAPHGSTYQQTIDYWKEITGNASFRQFRYTEFVK
jgi:hypothetical protein